MRWGIYISIATFFLACFFSVTSTIMLEGVAWGSGMLVVFILVLIGIFFDMMGIASAAAKETPFHAMAAERVPGSKNAIHIVRNADRFSSFCNDVIGDIVSIISGTATAIVVLKLVSSADYELTVWHTVISVIFSATVSALMVGGKAIGKSYAIHHANEIVLWIGKLFAILNKRLGLKLFTGIPTKKNRSMKGKRGKKRASGTSE
jgi:CBS domain containing-hemolysin-like protein